MAWHGSEFRLGPNHRFDWFAWFGPSAFCFRTLHRRGKLPPFAHMNYGYPCRLLAVHGATSCLSVRTQPLMATGTGPGPASGMAWHQMVTVDLEVCEGQVAAEVSRSRSR